MGGRRVQVGALPKGGGWAVLFEPVHRVSAPPVRVHPSPRPSGAASSSGGSCPAGSPLHNCATALHVERPPPPARLTTAVAAPATQVVTHLCYSDFEDIMASIVDMDGERAM